MMPPLSLAMGGALSIDPMQFAATPNFNSDTSWDITVSADDGRDELPIAALFVVTEVLAGFSQVDAHLSFGSYDGTNQWAQGSADLDGVTTTDSGTVMDTSNCVYMRNPGDNGNRFTVAATEFIPNGVRVTSTAGGGGYQNNGGFVVLFFGGGVGQSQGGTITPGVNDLDTVNESIGFVPDFIFGCYSPNNTTATNSTDAYTSIGIQDIRNATSRRSVSRNSRDNQANGSVRMEVRAVNNASVGVATGFQGVQFNTFTASQFTCTTRSNVVASTDHRAHYLALRLPLANLACGVLDTPASTGVQATATGFKPSSVLLVPSNYPTSGSVVVDSGASTIGVSGVDGAFVHTTRIRSTSGSPNSSTRSISTNILVSSGDTEATDVVQATLNAFSSTGFELNFTTTAIASRMWPYLAMGPK